MVSASWLLRKSSNRSACEPRAPRWTSEINKVRKRRSGLSSLEESLPMPVHLPDPCDKAMTIHATDGPKRIHDDNPRRESATRPRHGVTARCDIQATLEPVCLRVRGGSRDLMWLRVPAARSARVVDRSPPERGRREDRVRAAPAVSCATCTKENAHEHTGSAEAIRPSLRSGLRLTSRSPR